MASVEAMESIELESGLSSKHTESVSGGTKTTSESSGLFTIFVLWITNCEYGIWKYRAHQTHSRKSTIENV